MLMSALGAVSNLALALSPEEAAAANAAACRAVDLAAAALAAVNTLALSLTAAEADGANEQSRLAAGKGGSR